ncbi:hypothetical protein Tco_0064656, partial [Tanacetum coccineum]
GYYGWYNRPSSALVLVTTGFLNLVMQKLGFHNRFGDLLTSLFWTFLDNRESIDDSIEGSIIDSSKRMNDKCTMSEAIERGNLAWPNEWIEKFPVLKNYGVPNLNVLKIANADHGDNLGFNLLCGNIFGNGMNSHGSLKIANADHVDNLGFNLLSVGQICDSKCKVLFTKNDSEIIKDDKVIGHANMRLIQSLASKELVRNPPKLKFDRHFYDACKIGKQAHASHKAKKLVSTSICLELLHVDLFGPSVVRSYGGNLYTFVIVNDYSRSPFVDDDLDEDEVIKLTENKNLKKDLEDDLFEVEEIVNIKESKNHMLENFIGNIN